MPWQFGAGNANANSVDVPRCSSCNDSSLFRDAPYGIERGRVRRMVQCPPLHEVWPTSQTHVLADAGNGVITQEFFTNEFGNWSFDANLPEYIPGVVDALNPQGGGMPVYTEAVAKHPR
jgi:hypothetical protein